MSTSEGPATPAGPAARRDQVAWKRIGGFPIRAGLTADQFYRLPLYARAYIEAVEAERDGLVGQVERLRAAQLPEPGPQAYPPGSIEREEARP